MLLGVSFWIPILIVAGILVLLLAAVLIQSRFFPFAQDLFDKELDRVVRNNPYGKDLDARIVVEKGKPTRPDGIDVITMQARFRLEDGSERDVTFTIDFKGPRVVAVHWPDHT